MTGNLNNFEREIPRSRLAFDTVASGASRRWFLLHCNQRLKIGVAFEEAGRHINSFY